MSSSRLTFERGSRPVVAVLAFVAVLAVVSNVGSRIVMGPDPPDHLEIFWEAPFFWLLALGTWRALRYEGVTLADVGLGRSRFVPGTLAFLLFWGSVTLAGVGYLVYAGAGEAIGYRFDVPVYWLVAWLALTLLSNGLVEELVFRGYVQSKSIAIANRYPRIPSVATGILMASLAFAVAHVPTSLIVEGASARAIPGILLTNALVGVLFGVMYYLTQNVWFVGFVHGLANVWPVPFDPDAVPPFAPVVVVVLTLVVVGYRYWGTRTGRVPVRIEKRSSETTG